jgi:hypothetical protein
MAQLRDLGTEEFETVAAGDFPVAATDSWLVLLDGGQPVGALSPGSALDGTTLPAPIIVAPARLDLGVALPSPAFAQAREVSAVVLVEDQRVVGVWGGPRLEMAINRKLFPTRGGPVLPGVPQVPWIVRYCSYREGAKICATAESFPSKPFPMPSCRNDHHLSAHVFGW